MNTSFNFIVTKSFISGFMSGANVEIETNVRYELYKKYYSVGTNTEFVVTAIENNA